MNKVTQALQAGLATTADLHPKVVALSDDHKQGATSMFTEGIWERKGAHTMAQNAYVRTIAGATVLNAVLVACGALISYSWPYNGWLVLATFLVSLVCIFTFTMSDNPAISAVGVWGMSGFLGLMIGPMLALYPGQVILEALFLTAGSMVIMSAVGVLYPKAMLGFGPYILAALSLLLFAQIGQIILIALGFEQATSMPLINWAGIIIFLIVTAYDWNKALAMPYTLDNAVDASGGLILDAVNLFIRYVILRGGSSRK